MPGRSLLFLVSSHVIMFFMLMARLAFAAEVTVLGREEAEILSERVTRQLQTSVDPTATDIVTFWSQVFQVEKGDKRYQTLSLGYRSGDRRSIECVLAVVSGRQIHLFSADSVEPNIDSWHCDGAPALRFAEVNGDNADDLLAMFPFRPPSNEVFYLPLVFVFDISAGLFNYDNNRSRWLADWQENNVLLDSVIQMEKLLVQDYKHLDR